MYAAPIRARTGARLRTDLHSERMFRAPIASWLVPPLAAGLAAAGLTVASLPSLAGAASAVTSANVIRSAVLDGPQVHPAGGDRDGSGAFVLQFSDAGKKLCWGVTVRDIDVPTAIRVHRGASGAAGPVLFGVKVLPTTGDVGAAAGCIPASDAVLDALRGDPAQFYVQVATKAQPAGAIRGQLR